MTDEEFAYFGLLGGRFDKKGFPVESLGEVAAYRDLLFAVSRDVYLRSHPERERVPRGFEEEFNLRLTDVREGSTIAGLELLPSFARAGTSSLPGIEGVFERARDLLTEAIAAIAAGAEVPAMFPAAAISKLRKLGKTLRAGELLRFGSPFEASARVDVTPRLNDRFVELSEALDYPMPGSSIGRIVRWDSERGTFGLRSPDGEIIACELGELDPSNLLQFVSPDGVSGPLVNVYGTSRVSMDGQLQRFSAVAAVDLVNTQGMESLSSKLQLIQSLEHGWLGPGSVPPLDTSIARAERLLPALAIKNASIAALADGGIRAEWASQGTDYVLEIEADGQMYTAAIGAKPEDDSDSTVDFDQDLARHFVFVGDLGENHDG
ncbi:hypothetical protein ACIPY3_16370 [Paenarthrobacter sp. NPDC089714]|uniref:hypothetical protein n=1 Tax=Paenarthrobacter sp. NPDC089714 TaxID=3364377 RepID=UPI0037F81354